jgi:hypothetical protein
MLTLLKDLFSGLAAFLRIQDRRQAAMDDPAMKANAAAKTDAAIRDDAVKAVSKNDLDEIRKQAAE